MGGATTNNPTPNQSVDALTDYYATQDAVFLIAMYGPLLARGADFLWHTCAL